MNILVIDDDRLMREYVRTILDQAGHCVRVEEDGRAALGAYAEMRPDLVITDIFMPDEDGLRVIRRLRQAAPQAPIIAMSLGSTLVRGDYLAIARRLGAAAVLEKPFQPDALLETVSRVMTAAAAPASGPTHPTM